MGTKLLWHPTSMGTNLLWQPTIMKAHIIVAKYDSLVHITPDWPPTCGKPGWRKELCKPQ